MKRVQLEIVLGTLLVLLSVAIVVILGIQEPQRLADYTVQQRAQLIEFGASVFTTNCTRCHAGSHLRLHCIRADDLRRRWTVRGPQLLSQPGCLVVSQLPRVRKVPRHVS